VNEDLKEKIIKDAENPTIHNDTIEEYIDYIYWRNFLGGFIVGVIVANILDILQYLI